MKEVAVFGGGCFWCTEAAFSNLKGVEEVISGYSGGETVEPSYEAVCRGQTGHAEVIQVTYDPEVISYKDLLTVFFTVHDPTTLNRQGHDVGTQYRSVIFFVNEKQKETAEVFIQDLEREKIFPNSIVTAVEPLKAFYPAEQYHQKYYEKNPEQGYCSAVIAPKLQKLRKRHQELLKFG